MLLVTRFKRVVAPVVSRYSNVIASRMDTNTGATMRTDTGQVIEVVGGGTFVSGGGFSPATGSSYMIIRGAPTNVIRWEIECDVLFNAQPGVGRPYGHMLYGHPNNPYTYVTINYGGHSVFYPDGVSGALDYSPIPVAGVWTRIRWGFDGIVSYLQIGVNPVSSVVAGSQPAAANSIILFNESGPYKSSLDGQMRNFVYSWE